MLINPKVVFEDDAILIVEKPAGMPSTSLRKGEEGTLAAWLNAKYPGQSSLSPDGREAGLVNRLDNETSGLIVAARTPDAVSDLKRQFKEESVRKRYLALVIGDPPDRGVIEQPIAHHPSKARKMVACETEARARVLSARPAHTSFEVIERYDMDGAGYTLISVMIKSGARHQIRVHLASLGFPISGDRIYRNPKKRGQDPLSPDRHMLHSAKLTIAHPVSKELMMFESPLPDDFKKELARLSPKKGR